jgi:hypothetical protein
MSDSPEGPVLVLRHAAKSFGAVQALVGFKRVGEIFHVD